ncbi:hypothetical protein EGW08_002735 [Elysia chlorotica]|uniref:Uncharacterized protein n=1 Tax=Elysia chlorotica TaxID=188477 RepID=A0A3S0ZYV3_ELYCH|nr:hypothetical protein EGW08_002735 [Elysia chlorotica]
MMGRKTSVSGSKTPAAKQGKPTETSKAPKRQQRKPAPVVLSNGIKKKPVKSKPGFSLYPAGSKAEGDQQAAAAESARAGSSTKPGSRAQEKIEPSTEVVSQMQLQEEKAKSSQASSFYIPTADIEDSIHGQECDDFPVSAPFNKRLVSSTPDPERLVEAECEDQYSTAVETEGPLASASPRALVAPPEDSPQMIPERDVTTEAPVIPPDSTGLAATVAKGLAEKLKLQREAAHLNKRSQPGNSSHSEKAKQTKSGPLWKQKHQKWQEELEQYKKNQVVHPLGSERNNGDILNSTEASEIVIEPSPLGPMTKAEWISDSRPSQAAKSGASKSATDNHTKGQYASSNAQNIVGMNEMRKSIEDSGIQSIEVSTSAVSAVKANLSVPAQLPTTQSSVHAEQSDYLPQITT